MNKTTSTDRTMIAYDRTGDGPAVIIVEGAFCDRRTSAPLAALLSSRYTVFAYDRRGRGDSWDTAPWSIEREVEDLAAIVDEAGGSVYAYGMSSGAILALEAAVRGVAITRLAMYEGPVGTAAQRVADLPTRLSELVAAGRRGDAAELFMTEAVGMPGEVVAGLRHSPMFTGLEAIAHTLVYDTTITADPGVLDRAPTITVPTLVVGGSGSPPFLREAVRAMADAVPGARHHLLDGQTHELDPAALAPVLVEFFGEAM